MGGGMGGVIREVFLTGVGLLVYIVYGCVRYDGLCSNPYEVLTVI